ncbi:hypothetical protein V1506DRAFT_541620 [Lipomyces tetrasporus]
MTNMYTGRSPTRISQTTLTLALQPAHVSGNELAAAYSAYSGKPAKFVDIPVENWNTVAWKNLLKGKDTKIGFQTINDDNALLMTYGENFGNWWNLYRASGKNEGLIQRDYGFLDKIVPGRLRSVTEWMEKVQYTGEKIEVLKLQATTK